MPHTRWGLGLDELKYIKWSPWHLADGKYSAIRLSYHRPFSGPFLFSSPLRRPPALDPLTSAAFLGLSSSLGQVGYPTQTLCSAHYSMYCTLVNLLALKSPSPSSTLPLSRPPVKVYVTGKEVGVTVSRYHSLSTSKCLVLCSVFYLFVRTLHNPS